jgi:tricarballylate dehydrogenase
MSQNDLHTDVLVVGAGNAGLCAALAAAEAGADVFMLEKAPRPHRGGNTQFVSRYRFAFPSQEELCRVAGIDDELARRLALEPYPPDRFFADMMRASQGQADPEWTRVLADDSFPTIEWLAGNGMRFELKMESAKNRDGKLTWDPGRTLYPVDRGIEILRALYAAIGAKGVKIAYEASVVDLLVDEASGAVEGVLVDNPAGRERIYAGSVILASGGFQANPEMRAKYLGPAWDVIKVRGTRFNTGEALSAALRHGAAPFGQYSGCHATMVHAISPGVEMGEEVAFPHGYPYSITVNRLGERFVDEGRGFYASTYASYGREVLAQPGNIAFQVFDAVSGPWRDTTGVGRYAIEHPVADTLPELARAAGIDARRFAETVDAYNTAVQEGEFDPSRLDGKSTKGLAIEKSNWALPLVNPPFEAFPVECGLTFTYGGLATTVDGEVRGLSGRPLTGLYAVGEVAGSFFYNYLGGTGLMKGAVFGRRAGRHAAARSAVGRAA